MAEEKKRFTVSASPHVRSADTVTGIMLDVILALVPALIAAVCIFGWRVLLVTAVCILSCVLGEYITRKILKRSNTLMDLSAVVTGLLLAFNLPVGIPLWMAALGSVFAIVVVKQFFGGIGQNFVNPAIGGRIMMLVSFPSLMSSWVAPFSWKTDAVSSATPLSFLSGINLSGEISSQLNASGLPSIGEMFFGNCAGCIGETCTVALLIGALYLIVKRVINPVIPFAFIGTVAVFMLIAGHGDIYFMTYEILGGGLILGAFFMATDYSTSPVSKRGKLIFGIGCGIITCVIRLYGSLPEGVSYSIIIMNIIAPLIDKLTLPKPFGTEKKKKKEANAA